MKRRIKMLLFGVGALLLLALLAVIALPLWFPWVAPSLAREAGLSYSSYERIGYSSFALKKPVFRQGKLVVEAERVRGLTPAAWLWRLNRGNQVDPYIQVENWSMRIIDDTSRGKDFSDSGHEATGKKDKGAASWHKSLDELQRWLPAAELTNGVVKVKGKTLRVPHAHWRDGKLAANVRSDEFKASASIEAALQTLPYTARIQILPARATINLLLQTNGPGSSISGSALWESNQLDFAAVLPFRSVVPKRAEIRGTNLVISTGKLGLDYYEDLRGSLAANWEDGAFDIHVSGAAKPREENFPPLTLEFLAEGNTNLALVRIAKIEAPGIRAELSRNVELLFKQPWLAEPAQLLVSAEFDRIKWLPFCGRAQGNVFMSPEGGTVPALTFLLKGTDFGYREHLLSHISAEGTLAWPELQIHQLLAAIAPGSTATVSGSMNLSNKFIHAAAVHITSSSPPPAIARKVIWESLQLAAAAHGPANALEHSGRLEASGVSSAKTPAMGLALDWNGRHTGLEKFELSAKARTNAVQVSGSVSLEKQTLRAALSQLTISSNGISVLRLEKPAQVIVSATTNSAGWSFRATPFALSGSAGELRANGTLDWPSSGDIEASASGLNTTLIQEFAPVQSARIETLSASARWSNGPVSFFLSSAIDASFKNTPFRLEARVTGNENGTSIEQAAIVASNAPVLIASGRVPLTLVPGSSNIVLVDPKGPLKFTAAAQPHPAFWDFIGRATRWRVEKPELLANVTGTWSAPNGRAQFRAARVLPPGSGPAMPVIGPFNAVLHAEPGRLTLDPLEVDVQGQRLTATAELPLNKVPYENLRETLDLARASASIRVEAASISAFTPFIKSLAPEGQVGLELSLQPGFSIDGVVNVSGARTAPIGTLGPVRDVTLRARVDNNTASLQFARARIGGVPVTLQGEARLVITNLAASPFRVAVKGSKVPISRQSQAIIRADINSEIIKTNGAQPIITGNVTLRDSFFLSDLAALIPGKVANPRERPPYFSIEDKIIANWRLDLQATGIRGLRFRTPVVSGEVSPNIRLTGTLRNPVAVGDVSVNSGTVRFPFGSLNIQQGLITATTQDPAHPSISLTAAARQFGYDIRMEISGKIDSPVLQFSSTPPLSSDQILMMLTAGELPRGTGTLSAQQRAQSFAVFVGRDVLAKLGFGDQATDRLIIRSGEEFSEEGRPTYDVEYKLDKRWSITGEYDRFGDYNAGFKWRVYSR